MTTNQNKLSQVGEWKKSLVWVVLAAGCFQGAYASIHHPAAGLLIFGYAFGLVQLTRQPTVRRAFYFGLAAAYLSYAPQLFFMWKIFGAFAIILWLVLAFWVGLFSAMVCGCRLRWGVVKTVWLTPVIWTGVEYFRSEWYYLKFSWMNIGYALPVQFSGVGRLHFGMFGVGFLAIGISVFIANGFFRKIKPLEWIVVAAIFSICASLAWPTDFMSAARKTPTMAAVQMEFPSEHLVPKMLDQALAKNTNASIFVLSEYMLDGGVPNALKDWCRTNQRYLVVGGKDVVTNDVYYNTAFVVGTNGEMIFKQAKSVPIQFFHDGLPAEKQELWDSPWGKIGICICYDLSYTRVTDVLVEEGAQMLIVPTMDVSEWGPHQHELHSRVAPVRAAEYGIPIFRVASSGISQAVDWDGRVVARTSIGGNGEIMSATLRRPMQGSLPLDRYLAPVCTLFTGVVMALLFEKHWMNRKNQKMK